MQCNAYTLYNECSMPIMSLPPIAATQPYGLGGNALELPSSFVIVLPSLFLLLPTDQYCIYIVHHEAQRRPRRNMRRFPGRGSSCAVPSSIARANARRRQFGVLAFVDV